ncbi:MAG TPA: diguanylate cyclase [Candidatus Rifleibacterium sp.]|nr:diguanylate cyclase [Candidatus Rifleibacterium sp.]HPT47262.1 diguanylate cyclase [Candidatus Rifleibacterium sp.]
MMSETKRALPGFFRSIKVRAWIGIFFLTLLPLLSLGIYAFNILGDIARNILIEGNIQAFQQVKYEVDQYVSVYDDLNRYVASDARLKEPASEGASQALQQLDQAYEYVDRLVMVASDGTLLAHSRPDREAITSLTVPEQLLLQNASQSIFFSPEAFHVKANVADSASGAVVMSTVSFLRLRKSLEGLTFGTNFRYFLVTQNGENILEQPDFPKELISDLMEKPCGAYDLLPKTSGTPPQVAISLPILHYGLRIFVFQNASEVYAVARSVGRKTFNFVIMLSVVAFFLATWFSIRMTSPVIEIARKADELSEGNLEATVEINRNDELGFLAGCFNNMSRRIRKKVMELSALYRVTQLINTSATYQQALDGCLEHLVEIFQARRGSIMLLNEDRTLLRVESFKSASGSKEAEPAPGHSEAAAPGPAKKFVLKVGEGIAGEVARSGEPILCMDCRTDERFKNYDSSAGTRSPDTLISVPLTVTGNTMGVINLADRSNSRPFTSEDLDLLLAVANQMAMSIDNARLHEMSIVDAQTELYVRKFFEIRLEDEIKRARRFGFPLTLVMFSIDGFAALKDKYGQPACDAALFEIARILKDSVRATDITARSGSDEMAAILAHTSAEQSLIFAERLRERISAFEIKRDDFAFKVTVSIGICQYDTTVDRHYQLVNRAQEAMKTSCERCNVTTTWQRKDLHDAQS